MLALVLAIVPAFVQDLGISSAEQVAIEAGLTLEEEGVQEIEVGSGIAVVACATAYYNTDIPNPALVLQGQRYACLEASLNAQGQMLSFFQGMSVAAATEMKSKLTSKDTNDTSDLTAEFSAAETGSDLASGVLKGAVVYRIDDRPDEGAVSVWMVSSPKTRSTVKRTSPRGVSFADYTDGLEHIKSQVLLGVLPPTGGMLINVPTTGEVAWIGFGSALVNPTGRKASGRLAGRAKQAAMQQSRSLASNSLLDCIQGKPIRMEGEFATKYESLEKATENFTDGSFEAEASAASTSMDQRDLATVQAGSLPPAVTFQSATTEDGHWNYTFAILRQVTAKKAPAPSKSKASENSTASAESGMNLRPIANREAVGLSDSSPVAEEPCEEGSRKGVTSVVVRMTAENRQSALAAALIEAIQRTNGMQLESSLAMQSRFASVDAFVNGEEFSAAASAVNVEEAVSTKTAGLIDSYSVLSEIPAVDGYTMEVCVRLPSYDPNWRPGGKQVVAVLPFESPKGSFSIDGKESPSSDFTNEMEAVLVDALVASGDFYVIDHRNSKAVASVLNDIRSGVAAGKMQVREAGKVGQLKGIDILITGSLDELEYRNYKLRIPALKRDEARSSLNIVSQCRITNVADGTVLGQSYYSDAWGGDTPAEMQELQGFLSEWRGFQPAGAAFGAATIHHLQEISRVAETIRNGNRLKVVAAEGQDVYLEAFRPEFTDELSPGDVLQVKWRKPLPGGKEILLKRCLCVVDDIQGEMVVAKRVEGDEGEPVPGDFAERADQ